MRQILVDWLLELHWNTFQDYLGHSQVVQLAVQLVDRFIATKQVQRSHFQLVGAVAFGITCAASQHQGLAFTERHLAIAEAIQPNDTRVTKEYLIYMCDNAYTHREFKKMENEMLCSLRLAPVIPSVIPAAYSPDILPLLSSAETAVTAGGGNSRLWPEHNRHDIVPHIVTTHPRTADFVARFAKAAGVNTIKTSAPPQRNTDAYM